MYFSQPPILLFQWTLSAFRFYCIMSVLSRRRYIELFTTDSVVTVCVIGADLLSRRRYQWIVCLVLPVRLAGHIGGYCRLDDTFPVSCSMHGLFLTSMGCKVSSRRRYHSSCITYHGRAKWVSAHGIVEATISAPSSLHCTSHRRSRGIVASTIPGCRTHIGQTVHFSDDTATCTISLLLRQWHGV